MFECMRILMGEGMSFWTSLQLCVGSGGGGDYDEFPY